MKKITFNYKALLSYSFLLFLSITSSFSQNDYYSVISGGSTSGNGRAPQGARSVSRSVWLLTAAEMTAAGFATGDNISGLGFTFQAAQDIPTTGTMVVYLQNSVDATNTKSTTWSTAITGMTTASNGAITVPNTVGEFNYVFTGGSAFTYNGGSLYVAFDYQNLGTVATTSNVAYCNTSLTGGLKGAISAAGSTTAPTTVTASNFRPETRLAKPVSCARPTNLSNDIASTTLNSALLSWNSVGGSNVDLQYGAYNFTIGSGTTINNAVSSYTLSGLNDSTVYDYYVRTNCGAGGYSLWNGPYAFNTLFVPANLPYNTSFEQEQLPFVGWSTPNAALVAGDWAIGNYGAGVLVQDGVSSVASVTPSTTAADNWMFSRGVNLTAGNLVTVTYYISNYQATTTATGNYQLTVGNAQSVASQTQVLATETGLNVAAFTLKTYTFTPSTAGVYYFGFRNNTPVNATGTHALIVDNFSVSQVLSNESFVESSFSIYPNPSKDVINVDSLTSTFNTISIVDLNGRLVKNVNFDAATEAQVNISDLANGVYIIKIASENEIITKKIVKE